jgi:pyruvate/2-oxoglutarate dehydrogenase complex dihydrolipoamide dehydrogenase (E3) component
MVASAYAAHVARRAAEYGVEAGQVRVDMARVNSRKDAIVAKNRSGVEGGLEKNPNVTIFRGHARFESPRSVRVDEEVLESDNIFINVGGRASVPEMPGLHEIPYLTNSSIMHVDPLPRHLVVIGGSYIGLEFAQMFRRFGSQVTIVEMASRLTPREDEDVSAEIRRFLEAEGIDVRVNAKCVGFRREGDLVFANADCSDGGGTPIAGSHVLLAVGRRPNTDDLGLEKAGVATDEKGYIVVDDQLRTNVPGIWALGDCNGKGAFTHTSYNDAEIVTANILDEDSRRVSDRITTFALFTDPPLGRCGMTDDEAKKSGRNVLGAKRLMKNVGRAVEKGETDGFMKIVVDAGSKEILGAAILGTGGDEVVHSILDVMYAKAPYTTIQRAMHIHPTVAELVPTILGSLKPLP